MALIIVAICAVSMRCAAVSRDSVTRDEAFSWRLAQYSAPELIRRTGQDVHPPLYYLVLQSWCLLFGSSMLSLRSMSIVWAMATMPVLWATVRRASRHGGSRGDGSPTNVDRRAGALLAVALFAVHTSQVYPARDARMYSLGVFLGILTSWLLLRCLESDRGNTWRWLGYGFAVAAFCYTHNYAFFTVAAQAVFVAGEVIRRIAEGRRTHASRIARGFLLAGCCALASYAPWIPVLLHQMQEVRESYWIPKADGAAVLRVLAAWGGGAVEVTQEGGSNFVSRIDVLAWLLAIVFLTVATLAMRNRAMWFFFLLAAVPWGLSLGISAVGDRPIFHERYLIFAQVFLLGLWGLLFDRIHSPAARAGLIWFLAVTVAYNSAESLRQWSWQRPPGERAMRFVRARYDENHDIIVAGSYRNVNQLRYWAGQLGMKKAEIGAPALHPGYRGHRPHVASLDGSDFIPRLDLLPKRHGRIWYLREGGLSAPVSWSADMTRLETGEFTGTSRDGLGGRLAAYTVQLYVRKRDVDR